MPRPREILFALAILFGVLFLTELGLAEPGSFFKQAYVWQRQWTPAVVNAVTNHARAFNEIIVLAG